MCLIAAQNNTIAVLTKELELLRSSSPAPASLGHLEHVSEELSLFERIVKVEADVSRLASSLNRPFHLKLDVTPQPVLLCTHQA